MTVFDDPSKRNRHVRIEKPTETTTGGKTTIVFAKFANAWVMIQPLTGREYWEANRQASSITHKITGTYLDFQNVTADFRIVFASRTFNVLEPPRNIDEEDVMIEMMVEEETR